MPSFDEQHQQKTHTRAGGNLLISIHRSKYFPRYIANAGSLCVCVRVCILSVYTADVCVCVCLYFVLVWSLSLCLWASASSAMCAHVSSSWKCLIWGERARAQARARAHALFSLFVYVRVCVCVCLVTATRRDISWCGVARALKWLHTRPKVSNTRKINEQFSFRVEVFRAR